MRHARVPSGFTLIELLIVLVILAIITVLAMPNTLDVQQRVVLHTQVDSFSAHLRLVRAAAMSRGGSATLAPNDGTSWRSGWLGFVDDNADGRYQTDEVVLYRRAAVAQVGACQRISASASPNFSFGSDGQPVSRANAGRGGTIIFCNAVSEQRAVVVSFTGRIRNSAQIPAGACTCEVSL